MNCATKIDSWIHLIMCTCLYEFVYDRYYQELMNCWYYPQVLWFCLKWILPSLVYPHFMGMRLQSFHAYIHSFSTFALSLRNLLLAPHLKYILYMDMNSMLSGKEVSWIQKTRTHSYIHKLGNLTSICKGYVHPLGSIYNTNSRTFDSILFSDYLLSLKGCSLTKWCYILLVVDISTL